MYNMKEILSISNNDFIIISLTFLKNWKIVEYLGYLKNIIKCNWRILDDKSVIYKGEFKNGNFEGIRKFK